VGVIIGMDPHKRSATIEVVDERAKVLATCRFGTDKAGYAEMVAMGRKFADRIWAVEGCNGIGKHIAHRLVHDGETVLDVPAKLSAQVRVFATGNGRKTDPVDAHAVAMAALRTPGLARVQLDDDLVVMGILADRRDELGRARTQTVNRLHLVGEQQGPGSQVGEELVELGMQGLRLGNPPVSLPNVQDRVDDLAEHLVEGGGWIVARRRAHGTADAGRRPRHAPGCTTGPRHPTPGPPYL
jgi:hypothetical protein